MDISNNGGGGEPNKKQLPEKALPVFREGIYLVLSRWSALQLALENQWAGPTTHSLADQLASKVFTWFTLSKESLYIDDLEDILDDGMLSLNAMIDDGSIEEVAEKLMIMHEECLEGNYSSIEKLRQAGPSSVAHQCVRQRAENEDDEDDDEDGDDDNNMVDDRTQMMVDSPGSHLKSNPGNLPADVAETKQGQTEDGWEVVSSRRNRGKKN